MEKNGQNILNIERAALGLSVNRAARLLKRGGVAIYSTETFYAFGADPRNRKAVKKIFELKGRPAGKNLPLLASDLKQVGLVADVGFGGALIFNKIAKIFWPGPLTIILPANTKATLAPQCAGDGKVAIRISSNKTARALAARLGFPIVSTSANKSGQQPCGSIAEIKNQFGDRLPAPFTSELQGRKKQLELAGLAGLKSRKKIKSARKNAKPSTIIDISGGVVRLARKGAIPFSEILKVCRS